MKFGTMAKAGMAVLKGKTLGVDYPLFVVLSVTSRCQARCHYCQIPERDIAYMKTEQMFSLVDQIAAMGTQRLGIWGGEPLLRKDIGDIVSYAHEKGLYTTLDTNGYLLNKRWDSLKDLDHLIVSLDGDETAHDANREPGSWRKLMKGLEAVPRGTTLWTITVVTKHNLNSIDWILDKADEMGFMPTFQLLHHNDVMAAPGARDMLPTDAEYRDVLRRLLAAKKAGRKIGTSAACFEHLLNWEDYSKIAQPGPSKHFNCSAGKFYCNVDSDGTVYPCSLLVGEIPAPNFLEVGFEQAYKSLKPIPCHSCLATCFSEYNLIFSLHFGTIL
ncbi:MAG: radical SAM protein, partial [Armatimonadetes bacterium]|nr:radical SAM protein [Armatimonadota bacterium]